MPGYQVKFEQVEVTRVADLPIRSLHDRPPHADPHGVAEATGLLSGRVRPSSLELATLVARRPLPVDLRGLFAGCVERHRPAVVEAWIVDAHRSRLIHECRSLSS